MDRRGARARSRGRGRGARHGRLRCSARALHVVAEVRRGVHAQHAKPAERQELGGPVFGRGGPRRATLKRLTATRPPSLSQSGPTTFGYWHGERFVRSPCPWAAPNNG